MSGFSYHQPIFISGTYNPSFYLSLDQTGYLTYAYAQTLYLDRNDYRLSYLTGISDGTATPNLALVPASDGSITGLGALSCSSLTVDGSAVVAPPSYVVGITAGTAANNKALVLGASGEIATNTSLTATNIYGSIKTGAQPNILSIGTQNAAIATEFMNDSSSLLTYASWTNLSPIQVSCKLQMSNQGVSFIGTTNHQMRLGANGSNILYLQQSGNVSIGSSLDTHKLYVGGSLGIANQTTTTNTSLMSEYALSLTNPFSANGNRVGICFGVSGNQMNLYSGGDSIVHTRTDTNSVGSLAFNVKTSSGALDALVEAFRINSDASTTFNYSMTIAGNLTFSGTSPTITGLSSISATTLTGALSTAAQPAITSIGTLSALTIAGNLTFSGTSPTITGLSSISATTLTGTLSTGTQTAITSLGTLSALTIAGNLTFTRASRTITGLSSITATTLTGTLSTAPQTAITSVGTLSSLTVSGISSVGAVQIAGTEIITSGRHIQNIGNISCSGTMNAFDGYQVNGSTLTDSDRNVFVTSVIGIYAQLDKTAGSTYSSTLKTNEYNLALSNSSNVSATFSGLAFHIDTAPLSGATPGACIISERDSTTAYYGSSISFCTKGTAGSANAPTKRMTITKTGSINFGAGNSTDGDLLLIKSAGSPLFRFGSALSTKNCISLQ